MKHLARSTLLGLIWVLLSAAPASAHGAGGGEGSGIEGARAVALALALVAVAATVGPLVAAAAPPGRWRDGLSRLTAAGAVLLLPGIELGRQAAVLAFAAAGASVVAPRSSRWRVLPAVGLLVLVTAGGAGAVEARGRVLGAVHVVAAAAWLGGVVEVAVAWWRSRDEGRATSRAFARPAIGLVVLVAGSGALVAADHLGDASWALASGWGRALAGKVILVVTSAVVGALLWRAWAPRLEGVLLTVVAGMGLGLAVVGGPLSGPAPTGPLVLATDATAVTVLPLAPGPNVVLVDGLGADPVVEVDGEVVELDRRASGLLVGRVSLESGRHRIDVDGRGFTVGVQPVEADTVVQASVDPSAQADPDCLDRSAGAAAAIAARDADGAAAHLTVVEGSTCAVDDQTLVAGWDAGLRLALAALQARGAPTPIVVVDDDPRAVAAAPAVVEAAPGASLVAPDAMPGSIDGPVLVLTDETTARAVVTRAVAASGGVAPVVLAPWLLDAALLSDLADDRAPVLVAALRDPTSRAAVAYRQAATRTLGGGRSITAAGFEQFLATLARLQGAEVPAPEPGLFSVSRVAVLPASVDSGHESAAGWARGVALVRVG